MPVIADWPMDQGLDADLLLAARNGFGDDSPQSVVVAVSGGGDSVALLHLMHRVSVQTQFALHAVTVDHGLRLDSAAEAAGVAAYCAGLGIPHNTLQWRDHNSGGNLMDQARQARGRLIGDWARDHGVSHVALGHTADDEAETFLMGLARASGLDGLAGMRSMWASDGLIWSRPLLRHTRAALRDYLRRHQIAWVDDPTNDDDNYTRVKARKALGALAPLGITVGSITTSIAHLAVAQDALIQGMISAVATLVATPGGMIEINHAGFLSLPLDLQRRLLVSAMEWVAGNPYPPRSAKQITLLEAVTARRDTTLNGCRFRNKGDLITISREPNAVGGADCRTDQIWDKRWRVDGPHAPDLSLRALGADGLRVCKNWRNAGLSRDALLVSPAVWRNDALISAPLAGFNPEWTATIPIGFDKFILSH